MKGCFILKKKVFALLAAVVIALSASFACVTAFADDVSWKYDASSKTLTVYGNGKMNNYADELRSVAFLYSRN